MADNNELELDDLPMADEARLKSATKPEVKRGLASLRGVKRSTYLRRSVLKSSPWPQRIYKRGCQEHFFPSTGSRGNVLDFQPLVPY